MDLEQLEALGFIVLDSGFDAAQLNKEFHTTLATFAAFKANATAYVGGGFSALGNSRSFHNHFVRDLRRQLHDRLVSPLKRLGETRGTPFLEVLVDRMLYRPRGTKMAGENWHRDEAPGNADDLVLGGWINCGTQVEHFICVPRSQLDRHEGNGFLKLSKEDFPTYKQHEHVVHIRPGQLLLFNETLIHRVAPSKGDHALCRLFLGWRLTSSEQALNSATREQLERQLVVTLKSGQTPRMYPKLWPVNHKHLLPAFSLNLHDNFLDRSLCPVVLQEPPYAHLPYSPQELDLYKPH